MSKIKNKRAKKSTAPAVDNMPDYKANNNESEKIKTEADVPKTSKPVKKRGGIGVFIAVLFSLAALAGSGALYLFQNNKAEQLNARITAIESSAKSLSSTLIENNNKSTMLNRNVAAEIKSIKQSVAKLYTRVENSSQSWSIEEVAQLLQLANDQLNLAHDIEGAITALSIADRRIANSGSPDLQATREQIALDIASLRQVEQIDIVGTTNRLRAVDRAISELPVIQLPVMAKTENDVTDSDADSNMWQKVLDDMSSLVKLRHIDQQQAALLPLEQAYYLRENTRALIMSARLGLLQKNIQVYQNSLQQAHQSLAQHFDTNEQKTVWILNELKALTQLNPDPELPDISGSLSRLNEITTGNPG